MPKTTTNTRRTTDLNMPVKGNGYKDKRYSDSEDQIARERARISQIRQLTDYRADASKKHADASKKAHHLLVGKPCERRCERVSAAPDGKLTRDYKMSQ